MDIAVEQLRFAYPGRAFELRIEALRIASGSAAAVVGPSGSGKTTLLRLLAGIHRPSAGEVRVGQVSVGRLSDTQRRAFRIQQVGFVFQDFQLIEYLNVEQNIRLPFRLNRALRWDEAAAKRLEELMGQLGIADKRKRGVERLSQGEKQRVAIARALIAQPRVVLADEPTGNLDGANKRRIVEMLFEQARQRGATLVMVTHDRELLGDFERVIDFEAVQGERSMCEVQGANSHG